MEYKAFRIGALFEKLNAPYIGAGRKQDNVSKERTEEFSLPLINCKWGDNGIMYYGRPSDFVHYENVLSDSKKFMSINYLILYLAEAVCVS